MISCYPEPIAYNQSHMDGPTHALLEKLLIPSFEDNSTQISVLLDLVGEGVLCTAYSDHSNPPLSASICQLLHLIAIFFY